MEESGFRTDDGRLRLYPEEGDEGKRVDAFLSERVPELSRTRVQELIRTGQVRSQDGPIEKTNARVQPGRWIEVALPPPLESAIRPEDHGIRILHQDRDLAVVVKPAGMATHPTAAKTSGTLVNALQFQLEGLSEVGGVLRPGIVHRLDRVTSGILVVAKNDFAHHFLSQQFKNREVKKTYRAICLGSEPESKGVVRGLIDRDPKRRRRMMLGGKTGRESETSYEVVGRADPLFGILLHPKTGRTHQIRVHLEKLRCPIVLDKLYGYEPKRWPAPKLNALLKDYPGIFLHAERLEFSHPRTGESLSFSVDPPEGFQKLWTAVFGKRKKKS